MAYKDEETDFLYEIDLMFCLWNIRAVIAFFLWNVQYLSGGWAGAFLIFFIMEKVDTHPIKFYYKSFSI